MLQICEYDTLHAKSSLVISQIEMKWCVLRVQNKNNMPTSASMWLSNIAGNKEFRLMWSTRVRAERVVVWYRAEIQRGRQTGSDTSACCAFQSQIINANTSICCSEGEEEVRSIQSTGGQIWVGRGHISSPHKHSRRLKRILLFCSCSPSPLAASAILSQYVTWISFSFFVPPARRTRTSTDGPDVS